MKVEVIAILLGLISLTNAAEFNWFEESKIVNGKPTTNSDVPYLVYMENKGNFACGGAMVSSSHVVTAAHCVDGLRARDLTIVGGATYLTSGGTRRRVQKIILPRDWSSRTMNSDIAVLKLSTPMPSTVSVLPLCSQAIQEEDVMKLAGWGTQNQNIKRPSVQVQTFESTVTNKQKCANRYRLSDYNVGSTMFCISNDNGQDTCQGDSGGPAVHNGQLCGVVSWGNGCAQKGYPGVYTDINAVKTFVQKAMAY